jgi:predicted RNase H-like HicB family nuclease
VTAVNRYPAQVFWSEEDDGFVAIAPDLPGCSAIGDTQHEALAELQDAIAAWIEAARAAGNPIPPPSHPAREADYSGKILLRMPRDLHGRLASQAKSQSVSLNQYIVYLLTSASTERSIEGWIPTVVGTVPAIIPSEYANIAYSQIAPAWLNFAGQIVASTSDKIDFDELTSVGTNVVAFRVGARHG